MRGYWKAYHEKKGNEAKIKQQRTQEAMLAAMKEEQERLSYDRGPLKMRSECGVLDPTGFEGTKRADNTIRRI